MSVGSDPVLDPDLARIFRTDMDFLFSSSLCPISLPNLFFWLFLFEIVFLCGLS
jgi:hypothetical protein